MKLDLEDAELFSLYEIVVICEWAKYAPFHINSHWPQDSSCEIQGVLSGILDIGYVTDISVGFTIHFCPE